MILDPQIWRGCFSSATIRRSHFLDIQNVLSQAAFFDIQRPMSLHVSSTVLLPEVLLHTCVGFLIDERAVYCTHRI